MAKDDNLFDVVFIVGGEYIRGVWFLLLYHNKLFQEEYLKNPKKVYKVDELVTPAGFTELLKFYGFDTITITNDNIYEVITVSVIFNENRLLNHCKQYIYKYGTQEMCLKLIKNISLFKKTSLTSYKSFLDDIIPVTRLYGNYYFMQDVFLTLSIEAVEYLLKMSGLVVISETFVFEAVTKYYIHHYSGLLKDDYNWNSKFKSFSSLIHWCYIEKDKKEMLKLPILGEDYDSVMLKPDRKYFYCSLSNKQLQDLIIKYSTSDEYLVELNKEEKESLPNDLQPFIEEVLKMNGCRSKLVMMIIMIDFDIDDDTHFFHRLLNLYRMSKSHSLKQAITKSMILFIKDISVLEKIKKHVGMSIIKGLTDYKESMKSEAFKLILNFINRITLDDEEYRLIKRSKYNNDIIPLITSKLTQFSYPEKVYKYFKNMNSYIKPIYDGTKCKFTIKPNLPEGLSLNESNGIISGICNEISSNIYTITCKCLNNYEERNNILQYSIKIEISPLSFSYTNKNEEISIYNRITAFKEIEAPNVYNHCYIDMKMEYGVYKITYKTYSSESIMFGATTEENYQGNQLYKHNSYSFYISDFQCNAYGNNSYDTKDIPIRNKLGCQFKMIYDMDKRTISVIDESQLQTAYLLFHDIQTPLYPFVDLLKRNSSVQLMKIENV